MAENISVSAVIPVEPDVLFEAWLSSDAHSAFTGSLADIDPRTGGKFSVWDGYITGNTILVDPPVKIVQHWRTTDFPEGSPDSLLTITFEKVKGGTKLTLNQLNIPDGQGEEYKEGWSDFYFEPMQAYFKEEA